MKAMNLKNNDNFGGDNIRNLIDCNTIFKNNYLKFIECTTMD